MIAKRKLGPGDDKEMMESPNLWPHWPILPVKRGKEWPYEDGLMLAVEGQRFTVFHQNLFFLGGNLQTDLIDNPKVQRTVYSSLTSCWPLAGSWTNPLQQPMFAQ